MGIVILPVIVALICQRLVARDFKRSAERAERIIRG